MASNGALGPLPAGANAALLPAKRSHQDGGEPPVGEPAMKRSLSTEAFPPPAPHGFKDTAGDFGAACAYVLDVIHSRTLPLARADAVMRDVIDAWQEHVNPGFLAYRKSVSTGSTFAAIEWASNTADPHRATMLDAHGGVYIDVLGGFGIFNCGHSHPDIVAAAQAQLAKMPLCSQELLDPLRAYCAALLARTLPGDLKYAFFTSSGTESVEHSLKFAMLATGRRHYIGLLGAFHGKTFGSLSGTSKAVFRKPFVGGLLPFTHVPPNDVAALEAAFAASAFTGNEVAGLIMEPVLGEGGIHVLTDEFMRAARRLCDAHGTMLIFDEVQSGMGRTGTMWACQHAGVAPDIMAIGKAFGGGVAPAGAVVATPHVWRAFIENPFLTTTTFGGNPVSMAAAIATLAVLHKEGLPAQAAEKGAYMLGKLRQLQQRYPSLIREVRGRGLMIGLEFATNEVGYAFARGAFARHVIISGTLVNAKTIRVEPPLTISVAQLDAVLERFAGSLADMAAHPDLPTWLHAAAPAAAPSGVAPAPGALSASALADRLGAHLSLGGGAGAGAAPQLQLPAAGAPPAPPTGALPPRFYAGSSSAASSPKAVVTGAAKAGAPRGATAGGYATSSPRYRAHGGRAPPAAPLSPKGGDHDHPGHSGCGGGAAGGDDVTMTAQEQQGQGQREEQDPHPRGAFRLSGGSPTSEVAAAVATGVPAGKEEGAPPAGVLAGALAATANGGSPGTRTPAAFA